MVGPNVEGIRDQAFSAATVRNSVVIILVVSVVLMFFIAVSLSFPSNARGAAIAIVAFDV